MPVETVIQTFSRSILGALNVTLRYQASFHAFLFIEDGPGVRINLHMFDRCPIHAVGAIIFQALGPLCGVLPSWGRAAHEDVCQKKERGNVSGGIQNHMAWPYGWAMIYCHLLLLNRQALMTHLWSRSRVFPAANCLSPQRPRLPLRASSSNVDNRSSTADADACAQPDLTIS